MVCFGAVLNHDSYVIYFDVNNKAQFVIVQFTMDYLDFKTVPLCMFLGRRESFIQDFNIVALILSQ